MDYLKIFDAKFHSVVKNEIRSVLLENNETEGKYLFCTFTLLTLWFPLSDRCGIFPPKRLAS